MKTQIIELLGFLVESNNMLEKKQVIVRFTSDKIGESISLQVDNIMIGVPFEEINKLIMETRKL